MLNTWSMILNNWSYCFSCFKIKYWREKYILCFDQKHPAPFILINFWPFLDMTIVLFQTFCTVSIRFQKSFIQRFSASSSLFIFPPWNCVSAILHPPSSINHHPSSVIYHPSSIIILPFHIPNLELRKFFLELHKCHHSQLAPSSPTCVWSNELREREKEKRNLLNLLFLDQQPAQIDKTDRFTSPQYPIVLATASLLSDVWSLEPFQFPCSNDWKSSLVTTVLQFRKTAVYLSVNQYFDYLVMLTILANCAFLAMTEPINEAE